MNPHLSGHHNRSKLRIERKSIIQRNIDKKKEAQQNASKPFPFQDDINPHQDFKSEENIKKVVAANRKIKIKQLALFLTLFLAIITWLYVLISH
jgi:hypothetical protein